MVDVDLVKAREYYEVSSNLGYAEATYGLAIMHETGKGIPADPVKAAELMTQAQAMGMYCLGICRHSHRP